LGDLLQEASGIAARTNQILDPASNSRPEGLVSCGPASSHASDTSRTPVRLAFSPSQVTTSRPNFPIAAIAEAEAAPAASLAGRSDLRDLALVTIDGTDARDFDDAVWAEADPNPENRDGWHIVVAIADVAWYVRPGTALDREARRRGNSVYFPDRVVAVLPEVLSNDLCSLKPGVDRPCFAVHLLSNCSCLPWSEIGPSLDHSRRTTSIPSSKIAWLSSNETLSGKYSRRS
jgi:hypothetical protein